MEEVKKYTYDKDRPYCFISYSSKDAYCVHSVARRLIDSGFNLWIDWELEKHIGTEWDKVAEEAIFDSNCVCILLFMSESSCKSSNVLHELEFSKNATVVHNHSDRPIKIYPIEVHEIKTDNDVIRFLQEVELESEEEVKPIVRGIRNVLKDNKIKRLSYTKIMTDEGKDDLAESLKNDGFADVVENPIKKRFAEYYGRILARSSQEHIFDDLEPELLPTFVEDNSGDKITAEDIVERIRLCGDNKINYIMFGDGGIGKTTLLFHLIRRISELGVDVVLVPLTEIEQSISIIEYVCLQLMPETSKRPDYYISYLKSHKVIYLLDGLNEVTPSNVAYVKYQIEMLLDNGLNTVVTTRPVSKFQPKYKKIIDKSQKLDIIPLSADIIQSYLTKHDIQSDVNNVIGLVSSPLMLKLYVNQQSKTVSDEQLKELWREGNSEGTLIWNYLLVECSKKWSNTQRRDDAVLFALFYFAPFVAWLMTVNNVSVLKDHDRRTTLKKARELFLGIYSLTEQSEIDFDREFTERIPFPISYGDGSFDDTCFIDIMVETGLLVQQTSGLGFCHQIFRECLAALHCINSIHIFPSSDVEAFSSKALSENVLHYINSLDHLNRIKSYWHKLDKVFSQSNDSMTKINLIKLFNEKNNGSLAEVDFSSKDLRKISLNSYSLSNGKKGARFNRAKISDYTFSPPATHNTFITYITASDDFKYIISGDNNGKIIVYDAEQNVPVKDYVCRESSGNSVKGLFSSKQLLYACYKNGAVYEFDLSAEDGFEARTVCEADAEVSDAYMLDEAIYLASSDGLLEVSLQTGDCDKIYETDGRSLCCITCDMENKDVYLGFSDGYVAKFDVSCRDVDYEWQAHSDRICGLACNDERLYSLSTEGKVKKWDAYDEEEDGNWSWNAGTCKSSVAICLSSDGKHLFSASSDGNLIRVDGESGKLQHSYQFSFVSEAIHSLSVSKDGVYLLSDSQNNAPVIREIHPSDNTYRQFYCNSSNSVIAATSSSNGRYAIVQSYTQNGIENTLWDLENAVPCYVPVKTTSIWNTIAVSDDGGKMCVGQGEYFLLLNTNEYLDSVRKEPRRPYMGWLYSVLLNEEAGYMLIGVDDRRIYKLDADGVSVIKVSAELDSTANCFCTDRSSEVIYAGLWNGELLMIDTELNKLATFSFGGYNGWINDVCLSSDGKSIYVALDNGAVKKVDAKLLTEEGSWQCEKKRRWDKPCVLTLTVDRNSGYVIGLTGDDDAVFIAEDGFSFEKIVSLKKKYNGSSKLCMISQVKNTSCFLLGDTGGGLYLYDALSDETVRQYKKIRNASLVGCDFRKSIFSNEDTLKEALRCSGALVE